MERAVRGARIEPTIVATWLETAFFASQDSELPKRQTALCRSKRCRRERNFWIQRPEAKNPPERPLLSAETGNSKIGVKNPRRNGLFLIDDGFRSSGRLDGGVRSHMRTRLPVIWPISGSFSKKTANWRPKVSKRPAARAFLYYCANSISGRNRERPT